MILGILLLMGGGTFLILAFMRLRGANAAQADTPRLVIGPMAGRDDARIMLLGGGGIIFGPHPARWDAARSMTAGGKWRVATAVDLSGEVDALAAGDARLAATLRGGVGPRAMVLEPLTGGRPVLLHTGGSAGGVGIAPAHLDALFALLGNPAGLEVELVRRNVQRAGWGSAQGQRRRARQ